MAIFRCAADLEGKSLKLDDIIWFGGVLEYRVSGYVSDEDVIVLWC